MTGPGRHEYLSTACWHELNDGKPDLHGSCRARCKFDSEGDAEFCSCPNHVENDNRTYRPAPVDQARDAFLRLLAITQRCGIDLRIEDPDLFETIRDHPDWPWARGDVQPAGVWCPTTNDKKES